MGVTELDGKNAKFRRITFLRVVSKNIRIKFQHYLIKIVDGVRKSTEGVGGGGNNSRAKNQNSAALHMSVWSLRTFLYSFSTLQSKQLAEFPYVCKSARG